jgi:uncharacterized protein YbjT (DUF2867 family)
MEPPRIAVLGAAGLIGFALARDMMRRGFPVQALARRFTRAQAWALAGDAVPTPLVSLPPDDLARLLADIDIVVNCIGVLQDGPLMDTDAVHRDFAERLSAICAAEPQKLLIQLSVPGAAENDRTAFSISKRKAEGVVALSGAPFIILRPGFVIAPAAFGGSALMRALAAMPLRFAPREASAPFATIGIGDICETVARTAARWETGERAWRESWDLMEERPGRVGDILETFRAHSGGPKPLFAAPSFLMTVGAWAGDAVAWLGWTPPVRSTAIREMRRGVTGDPSRWIAATGIVPLSAPAVLAAHPATVQEKWFARLYLLKALSLAILVIFWCVSSLIALTAAFSAARDILLHHGFSFPAAHRITLVTSMMDFAIGVLIAFHRTSRFGLIAGIVVSLGYMAGSALIAPELWIEPLGALVKTGPAIVLMLVCLALSDNR